jgi:hypothetical protein
MKNFLLAVATIHCLVFPANADIELTAGDVKAVFGQSRCWTMVSLSRNGAFCEASGSGQGTVIDSGGIWVGSIHGNETLQSASLAVDGVAVSLQDGQSYLGNSLTLARSTLLGPVGNETYSLVSEMEISSAKIVESVSLTRTSWWQSVRTVYGFLSSRANRLTAYAAFDANGTLVDSGQTIADEGDFVYFEAGVVSVAQYDPLTGDGIISTVTKGSEYELDLFIWDRVGDNKLYCQFENITDEGSVRSIPTGTTFDIQQETLFFEATPETWVSSAQALVPEPATLLCLGLGGLYFGGRKKR